MLFLALSELKFLIELEKDFNGFFFFVGRRDFFMCWLKNFTFFLIRLNLLKPDEEVHIIKITPAFFIYINPRLSSYCGAINPHIYGFLCINKFVIFL